MNIAVTTETAGECAPTPVVVFVHGTWATDKVLFALEGSYMRDAIEKKFAPVAVKFESFRWRGLFGTHLNNNHGWRTGGGANLARYLLNLHTKHPNSRLFIVAHSHGGTVAMYALGDEGVQQIPGGVGVVCLATPFIICQARKEEGFIATISFVIAMAVAYLFATILAAMVFIPLGQWEDFAGLVSGSLGIGILFTMLTALLTMGYTTRLVAAWLKRKQEKIVCRLRMPDVSSVKMLCLGIPGDEALWFLRSAERLSDAARKVFKLPLYLAIFIIVYILQLVWFVWSVWRDTNPLHDIGIFATMLVILGFTIIMVIPIFLGHLVVMFLLTRLRANGFFYGYEGLWDNFLAHIAPQTAPPGKEATFEHCPSVRGIRHSRLYKDPEVINRIANWIHEQYQDGQD